MMWLHMQASTGISSHNLSYAWEVLRRKIWRDNKTRYLQESKSVDHNKCMS